MDLGDKTMLHSYGKLRVHRLRHACRRRASLLSYAAGDLTPSRPLQRDRMR
jgi:hypothetical protein